MAEKIKIIDEELIHRESGEPEGKAQGRNLGDL